MNTSPLTLLLGDCLDSLRSIPDNSIDSVVTDPPYGIRFMGKSWDGADIEARAAYRASMPSHAAACGPNGGHRSVAAEAGKYDLTAKGMLAFQSFTLEWASECLRVLKPGGHLLSFAAARTYHHMAVGIEMAGFEIRDQIMWVFGSGFPKSHNLRGEFEGWGTALKPAHEPICMARKPFTGTVAANVLEHGTGAINVDACRIAVTDAAYARNCSGDRGHGGTRSIEDRGATDIRTGGGSAAPGRWPANLIHDGSSEVVALFPAEAGASAPVKGTEPTSNGFSGAVAYSGMRERVAGAFHGDSGSAARFFKQFEVTDDVWLANLSPALSVGRDLYLPELADAIAQSGAVTSALPEGIALSAAKALSTSVTQSESRLIAMSVIEAIPRFVNASLLGLQHDVHILSQSPVKLVARREQTGTTTITASLSKSDGSAASITFSIMQKNSEAGAKGLERSSADRFMYCAKTSRKDRNEGLQDPGPQFTHGTTLRQVENTATTGNTHPTVKPTDLMAYLCRLVTPPGGLVLDPFMGSGSTGKAAMREGFQFIGCELDEAYMAIARARIEHEAAKQATLREVAASAAAAPAQADMFLAAVE